MDDLISRQAAIDAIADYLSKTTYTSAISFLNTGALILAKVPTAEPRKGKWVLRPGDYICIYTAADGFLYNMVRIMVGTVLKGKDIRAALETPQRSMAGPTAPAEGLYLNKVFYSKDELEARCREMGLGESLI